MGFIEREDMLDEIILNKLIGEKVISTVYGPGSVSSFHLKDDGQYYVTILFDDSKTERTFLASVAFFKKILVFEDADLNRAVILALEGHDIESKLKDQENKERKKIQISTNDAINILIESVLNEKSIALDLISFYDDTAFEKELCEEAFGYLESAMSGSIPSNAHNACIVCALTLIALKYYDGDLHSYIEEKYREYRPETERRFSRNNIQNAVYKVLGDFRVKTKYFDLNSYVAVPLILCGVPHYRLNDLFKISYDIYEKKCLYDDELSDEQINVKVYETLVTLRRKDLISESDTIKGTNYLMSRYTQSCIYSGYGIDILSQIITHCIRLIINHMSRFDDSFVVEPYYKEGYDAWVLSHDSDEKEIARYESGRNTSQPFIKLINTEVHLFTGETIMDDRYDPNTVHICIYKNDRLLEDILITDPNAIEYQDDSAMSGFVIRRQEVIVPGDPLGDLSYKIVCSEDEIYDSRSRLFRKNLFFDGRGNEIKPGSVYAGELFVITNRSSKDEYEDKITEVYQGDGYLISTIEVNSNDVYYFDDEPYIFYKVSAAQMLSNELSWCEFVSTEKNRYPIYNDIRILLPASCDEESLLMEIDNKRYSYWDDTEVHFSVKLFSREVRDAWVYSVKVFGLTDGFHIIRVYNSETGNQIKGARFSIIYDQELKKKYVTKDDTGILCELSGNIIEDGPILFKYGLPQIELNTFVKGVGYGKLVIYPFFICYSIDGSKWFDIDETLFLNELPINVNEIQVCGPRKMAAYYLDMTATAPKQGLNLWVDKEHATKYSLSISYLRQIQNKKNISVFFEEGNAAKCLGVRLAPDVLKGESRFYHDQEKGCHVFDIRFKGSDKVKVVIRPLYFDTEIASKVISNGELIEIPDSVIDNQVLYLSISLYGKKNTASLFEPYQNEPFYSFPRYDLGRPSARLIASGADIKVEKRVILGRFLFEGTKRIKAEIVPTGFNTPLLSCIIESGEMIALNTAALPFNSYMIFLYSALGPDEDYYSTIPFFYRQIKVESPLLHQTFAVSAIILTDGTRVKSSYSIRINAIEEIDEEYYMVASLQNRKDERNRINNLFVTIEHETRLTYELSVRHRVGESFERLKGNGRTIEAVVVEKIGGWI